MKHMTEEQWWKLAKVAFIVSGIGYGVAILCLIYGAVFG